MTDYLVYNDQTGEFVATDSILTVYDSPHGSGIILKDCLEPLFSPLKPRELLRRLTIMRFKRENTDNRSTL